jgi:hypothetical protein
VRLGLEALADQCAGEGALVVGWLARTSGLVGARLVGRQLVGHRVGDAGDEAGTFGHSDHRATSLPPTVVAGARIVRSAVL